MTPRSSLLVDARMPPFFVESSTSIWRLTMPVTKLSRVLESRTRGVWGMTHIDREIDDANYKTK